MDCMDCHNRPTHTFDLPENAVNREMAAGRISPTLPFIHKEAIELLKENYRSRLEAQTELPQAVARVLPEELLCHLQFPARAD